MKSLHLTIQKTISIVAMVFCFQTYSYADDGAWTGGKVSLQQKKLKDMKSDAYRIEIKGDNVTIISPSDIGIMVLYNCSRSFRVSTF